ncbi:MAG: hypothetical protein KDD41_12285 [Flavobacteriales bacterium]|nr:hypothetical protein [Flavobacteriales bacterium]
MVYEKHIELQKAHLYLVEEGFTMLKAKDNVDFELEDAVEVDELTYQLVNGNPFVTIVDGRNVRSNMSHEARQYFASNKKITDIRKAQSIVVNNLHTKLLANFYMNFYKPSNPIKIFRDFEEAEKWVRKIHKTYYPNSY